MLRGRAGLALVAAGEALILIRLRPVSDFYFPLVWLGYILILDAAVQEHTGRSLFSHARGIFLALFPVSAAFWWLFEFFNQFVHSWQYIGGESYTGLSYVALASLDFSFVLPAVWASALFINALLPRQWGQAGRSASAVPTWLLQLEFGLGLLCLVLPVLFPRYAFGLIWGCMWGILDPINHRLGRPSVVGAIWQGQWRLPVSFAFAALMCGFFWEAWNFWAMPKWIYTLPYVNHWHIFEMPLLGWFGYLPFGLELFAMTNFVLPFLGFGVLGLRVPEREAATLGDPLLT